MKKYVFIDGLSILFRAYYAMLSQRLSNSKGFPTGALLGFVNAVMKIIEMESDSAVAVAFDPGGKNFRHELYPEYKAHRQPVPEDLVIQIPKAIELMEALKISVFKKDGFEADDVIGSLARKKAEHGAMVKLFTGDKDYLQLITDKIQVCLFKKGVSEIDTLNPAVFRERYGILPEQFVDVKALMGDASDNIPGVSGIGEKTALQLIQEFGTLENIYDSIESVKGKKREKLEIDREKAFLSRKLSRIVTDIPLDDTVNQQAMPESPEFVALVREYEFDSILKRISHTPTANDYSLHCIVVDTEEKLRELCTKISCCEEFSVDLETTSEEPVHASVVGISVSIKEYEAYYIPVGHIQQVSLLEKPKYTQLDRKMVLEMLRPYLENPGIKKLGQNLQYEYIVFQRHGINFAGLGFDTMIAGYLLNPERAVNLDALCEHHLNHTTIKFKDVLAKNGAKNFSEVSIDDAAEYSGEDAEVVIRLRKVLEPKLKKSELWDIFVNLEMPLIKILSDMTLTGIYLECSWLSELEKQCVQEIQKREENIYRIAGEHFNINSPKQLGTVLFDKLGIKPPKKTKTGYSTDMSSMEMIKKDHEIAGEIIEYRKYTKLLTTYISALPQLVAEDKRIHTHFNQTIAATGRLSSTNPNLQNIPVRDDFGKKIRHAFSAPEGWTLVSADYSQIELRVLAHLSEDPGLTEAFRTDLDIHAATASKIFSVPAPEVTAQMRSYAKTINFGVLYGMNAYRLAGELEISMKEAAGYIEAFFNRFSSVRNWKEHTEQCCSRNGYVTTILGRRRYIPDINSSNKTVQAAAARMAVNTAVQGSAADIIKKSMIDIAEKIKKFSDDAHMLIQIHDELVFEVIRERAEELSAMVRSCMKNAYDLSVPLKVNISAARYWDEVK